MTDESLRSITCVEMWAVLIQGDTKFKARRLNLKCCNRWLYLLSVDVYCFPSSLLSSLAVTLTGKCILPTSFIFFIYIRTTVMSACLPTFDFVLGEKSNYYHV